MMNNVNLKLCVQTRHEPLTVDSQHTLIHHAADHVACGQNERW